MKALIAPKTASSRQPVDLARFELFLNVFVWTPGNGSSRRRVRRDSARQVAN
jgi:hypothetical protein